MRKSLGAEVTNRNRAFLVLLIALTFSCLLSGQAPVQVPTSVDSTLLMDAAGPQLLLLMLAGHRNVGAPWQVEFLL